MATDLLRITVSAPLDASREDVLPAVEEQAARMATIYGQIRYVGPADHIDGFGEQGQPVRGTPPDGMVFHVFECDAIARA